MQFETPQSCPAECFWRFDVVKMPACSRSTTAVARLLAGFRIGQRLFYALGLLFADFLYVSRWNSPMRSGTVALLYPRNCAVSPLLSAAPTSSSWPSPCPCISVDVMHGQRGGQNGGKHYRTGDRHRPGDHGGSTSLASRAVKNDPGVGFRAAPATASSGNLSLPRQ